VAKYGLAVGIDVDLTGLKKAGQQAAATLEGIRGQFNRMQGLFAAGMASPLFQAIGSFYEANREARKTLAELVRPFSTNIVLAEIDALHAKMDAGRRMVGLGMDEMEATRIRRNAQLEIGTGLIAEGPGGMVSKSMESFFTSPGSFLTNVTRGLEGNLDKVVQDMGIGFRMLGGGAGASDLEKMQMQAAGLRSQLGFAMATGSGESVESLNLQLLRVLEQIKQNTDRSR
jgi:hypothetical protein